MVAVDYLKNGSALGHVLSAERTTGQPAALTTLDGRFRCSGKPKIDQQGLIEPHQVCVINSTNEMTQFRFGNGRDLVHHQATGRTQAIFRTRNDDEAQQRRIGWIRGEGANGDGVCAVETIILNDDNRTRLTRIILAARNGPDLAPFHSSPQSDMASINA